MEYAPQPTEIQLAALGDEITPGGLVRFDHRILGGVGCTMDVLAIRERDGSDSKVVLRRRGSWSRDNTIQASHTELEVLRLLRRNGIPAPEPLWLDENGIFTEPASLIEFIDGRPLMAPEDPDDYATQLASALVQIHDVKPEEGILSQLRDYNAQEESLLKPEEPPDWIAGHHLGRKLWDRQRSELVRTGLTERTLLHGDYWPGNTIWQGQKLAAVVDFEEIGIGDPALDVATAVVNFRFETWRDASAKFLDVYQVETGRRLDTLDFWSLRELRRPMPDIARWLPSFKEISSHKNITAAELRHLHDGLIREALK